MHFEVLVEDQSGSVVLQYILEKILGPESSVHSWKIHAFKGLGALPKHLNRAPSPRNWLLLEQLPRLLQAYGRSLKNSDVVLVVVDLDREDCVAFKLDLLEVQNACNPQPRALFRIAIEEIESWLLGDRDAVKAAYPDAKDAILNGYVQDSICGTWEMLADAVHPGGSQQLKAQGYQAAGTAKREWAEKISPLMDVDCNDSKSFQVFRDGVKRLAGSL